MPQDKITFGAIKRALARVISPVIVKAKVGKLAEVMEWVRPYIFQGEGILGEEGIGLGILRRSVPMPEFSPLSKLIRRFNLLAMPLPREAIFSLAEGPYVDRIFPDTQMFAFDQFPSVPQDGVFTIPSHATGKLNLTSTYWTKKLIGAEAANAKGFKGSGVLVSIIDTGASRVHQQIRGIRMESTMLQQRDENGHGTWCTTCIGGLRATDMYVSQRTGRPCMVEGMAPECDLMAVKVLGWYIGTGFTSNIIDGITRSVDAEAKVLSMSLGGECEAEKPEDDPFLEVFAEATKNGIIPVIAAGNEGPKAKTIGSPGAMPNVLTVGAYDPITGQLAKFSSRGPTNWGDVKPDVMAPGVNINSGIVGILDGAGDGVPNRFSPISGTSMATPHVAGLVALMCEAHRRLIHRELTVEEIKTMVKQLGKNKTNETGWGKIDWAMYENWMNTQYGIAM